MTSALDRLARELGDDESAVSTETEDIEPVEVLRALSARLAGELARDDEHIGAE